MGNDDSVSKNPQRKKFGVLKRFDKLKEASDSAFFQGYDHEEEGSKYFKKHHSKNYGRTRHFK